MEIHAIELAEEIRLKGVIPIRPGWCSFRTWAKRITQQTPGELRLTRYRTYSLYVPNMVRSHSDRPANEHGGIKEQYEEYISKRFDEHVNRIFCRVKAGDRDYSLNQQNNMKEAPYITGLSGCKMSPIQIVG